MVGGSRIPHKLPGYREAQLASHFDLYLKNESEAPEIFYGSGYEFHNAKRYSKPIILIQLGQVEDVGKVYVAHLLGANSS